MEMGVIGFKQKKMGNLLLLKGIGLKTLRTSKMILILLMRLEAQLSKENSLTRMANILPLVLPMLIGTEEKSTYAKIALTTATEEQAK